MGVARNVVQDPRLVPGGGATEMSIASALKEKADSISGIEQVRGRGPGASPRHCTALDCR